MKLAKVKVGKEGLDRNKLTSQVKTMIGKLYLGVPLRKVSEEIVRFVLDNQVKSKTVPASTLRNIRLQELYQPGMSAKELAVKGRLDFQIVELAQHSGLSPVAFVSINVCQKIVFRESRRHKTKKDPVS